MIRNNLPYKGRDLARVNPLSVQSSLEIGLVRFTAALFVLRDSRPPQPLTSLERRLNPPGEVHEADPFLNWRHRPS